MSSPVLFGLMQCETAASLAFGMSLVALVWLFITTIVFGKATSSFRGGLSSELGKGVVSSAPGMRFQPRTDTGSSSALAMGGGDSVSRFLGSPEPPVFYNVGDISSTRSHLGSVAAEGPQPGSGASGFSNFDERLLAMQ